MAHGLGNNCANSDRSRKIVQSILAAEHIYKCHYDETRRRTALAETLYNDIFEVLFKRINVEIEINSRQAVVVFDSHKFHVAERNLFAVSEDFKIKYEIALGIFAVAALELVGNVRN